jgi:S-adenosylmethionine hydrolase
MNIGSARPSTSVHRATGWIEVFSVSHAISGKVVEIDSSGDLVTDIACELLAGAPTDASLRVVVDEHETFGLYYIDHDQPEMTLIAITEASKPLKISLVGDSASDLLGVRVGALVEVSW